jgi:hypothetical protein
MVKADVQYKPQYRFGIGEWYGKSFVHLSRQERQYFAQLQQTKKKERPAVPCPPKKAENPKALCTKEGGICSLRLYKLENDEVSVARDRLEGLVTTCPYRFNEGNKIYRWIGETILNYADPIMVKEVPFLEKPTNLVMGKQGKDDVGRIDLVLVRPEGESFSWCAVEMQAVYFSGDSMKKEFDYIAKYEGEGIPFPVGKRRPDFRSSGPKRLMPQLQIKVPTLRRWGKKMVVVIDHSFFSSISEMAQVKDLSNADIAWFVVNYREENKSEKLETAFGVYTTLERSVEGLTGGLPVSLGEFEKRIKKKIKMS